MAVDIWGWPLLWIRSKSYLCILVSSAVQHGTTLNLHDGVRLVSAKNLSERWPYRGRVKSKVDVRRVISGLLLHNFYFRPYPLPWVPPMVTRLSWDSCHWLELIGLSHAENCKNFSFCSLQLLLIILVCGGPIHIFQNGLHSMLTVLLPLLPFSLNNGSPQILWILRKKLWILCCQFAFFASSFKFTLNWIFWQICNSSFQIRLKRKIWKMLAEDFIIKLVWKN